MVGLAEPVAKPRYRVPTMDEVRAIEPNGYRVVSTFSGCGGSCVGFRMAGFAPVWASEFIPIAADTYAANAPDVPLDRRDIREVDPDEILAAAGLDAGEVDVMEGSPPCASFSASSMKLSHRGWGKAIHYSGVEQRVDDLFFEFARVRDGVRPKVFVAENVQGLVRGVARGFFKEIHARLSQGYRVEARLLDASWLGVPQQRRRVIFVGVRDDLGLDPVFPEPLPYRYSLADALDGIDGGPLDRETGENVALDGYKIAPYYDAIRPGQSSSARPNLIRSAWGRPAPTLTATADVGAAAPAHPSERRKFNVAELRALASFPPDFVLLGNYRKRSERIGRAVPPLMMRAVAETLREEILDRL